MAVPDKEKLRLRIEATLKQVEAQIVQLEDATRPIGPENAIGRVSRMDAINSKGVAEASLRSAVRKRSSLRTALKKLDSPNFGLCARCRRPIPEARLMFMPESSLCVPCAARS